MRFRPLLLQAGAPARGSAVGLALALVLAVHPSAGVYAGSTAPYLRPGHTERVSLSPAGAEPNNYSAAPSLSHDGRYVAFDSWASNLVPGDTNGEPDVFVRDRLTGSVERVSVASDGHQANAVSADAAISADGRHVAFTSLADNLIPGADGGIFVRDRVAGTLELISVDMSGRSTGGSRASISADGRHVAFTSSAGDLVPGDTNGFSDVFVRDRVAGVTERVSVASDGSEGTLFSGAGVISPDGRHVGFNSFSLDLVPFDTNASTDVFVHDRLTGATELVSVADDGSIGGDNSSLQGVSDGARHVVFASHAGNLVPGDSNGTWDFFVRDREAGRTERVTITSAGAEGTGDFFLTTRATITPDGRHVAYGTLADRLVESDENMNLDVLVHDRETGATELVTRASDGSQGFGLNPSMSADGRYVAFTSLSTTLVPGDTNDEADVYLRDRGPELGVGDLATTAGTGGAVRVAGWATFSGGELGRASDPIGDVAPEAGRLAGVDLIGASISIRPEPGDLMIRWRLAGMPSVRGRSVPVFGNVLVPGAAAPPALYGLELRLAGVRYEVRGALAGAPSGQPGAPAFSILRCDPACTEVAALPGSMGTAGEDVRVSVPLSALDPLEGASASTVRAWTAAGSSPAGAAAVLDEVALPGFSLGTPSVRIGLAPAGTPEEAVDFASPSMLSAGRFEAEVEAPSGATGSIVAWARACLGTECRTTAVPVPPSG